MYHDLPRTARFWSFLFAIDQDLAETRLARTAVPAADACTPPTTSASPGAPPSSFPSYQCLRLSFCCDRDGCRKRVTPPSVRFLGRKVYLGAIVILISAMRQGPSPRRVRELSERFGADRADHRSLAGLLARTLSPDAVLEDRTRPFGAAVEIVSSAVLAGRRLPPPPSPLQGLDAPAAVSRTDHDPRRPCESRSRTVLR